MHPDVGRHPQGINAEHSKEEYVFGRQSKRNRETK
jgi:hypothetical protein